MEEDAKSNGLLDVVKTLSTSASDLITALKGKSNSSGVDTAAQAAALKDQQAQQTKTMLLIVGAMALVLVVVFMFRSK